MRLLPSVLAVAIAAAAPAQVQAGALEVATIEIGGRSIAYVDEGDGPAVVLIHGLGADLTRWRETIGPLSARHRVIALDLLGFGRSDKPDTAYRGQVFVDQIFDLLDALGIERATLIGNSMGGWIALLAAEQQPTRVDGLVLVAPAFVQGLPSGLTAERLAAGAAPQTEAEMRGYLARVYADPPRDRETVRRLLAEHRERNADGAIAAVARSLEAGEDLLTSQRLAALETRALIVHGDADGVVPVSASQSLAEMMPNARVSTIANAGHWPQIEAASRFLELVDAFRAKE
ncbi:MAG: alpha/beta fold hydrolase [Pseudomonadota bacterium]